MQLITERYVWIVWYYQLCVPSLLLEKALLTRSLTDKSRARTYLELQYRRYKLCSMPWLLGKNLVKFGPLIKNADTNIHCTLLVSSFLWNSNTHYIFDDSAGKSLKLLWILQVSFGPAAVTGIYKNSGSIFNNLLAPIPGALAATAL